jgi:4-amino-4-deoxy-L-arabinose transferase-like glycosyltransferase
MIRTLAGRARAMGPWRATLWLALAVALLHLLVAGRAPLTADEAHYALYGLNPDWSYFDHPPLVGWLQALVLPLSQHEFALRLWPIVLAFATALALFRFARRLFPNAHPWLGFWSVALYLAGPLFQAIGLALVPETPLLLLALLALLNLLNALDRGRLRDWLLFGVCLGLAGLAKYTAVTLAVSALAFVVTQRRIGVLRTPGPWLALLVAALLITPVLYWNATHDWLSFRYQLGHGFRPKDWDWSRVALSQAGQLLAYAPALFVAGLVALVAGFRQWRERGVQLALLTVWPVLLLFAFGSGREETLPHWTALAWLVSAPLAARWLMAHWPRRSVRVLAWVSGFYSAAVILFAHVLLLFPSLPGAPSRAVQGVIQGWPEAAARARALRDQMQDPAAVLFVPNWSLASRLAWYARPLPVQVTDTRFDQFDLWFGSPAGGANGVLVVPGYALKRSAPVLEQFASCTEQAPLAVGAATRPVVTFHFHLCRGYRVPDPISPPR